MKASIKVTRLQLANLYDAIDTAICIRNVGHVEESFLINAHLATLQPLRNKLYNQLHEYKKSYAVRFNHDMVVAMIYLFISPPFDKVIKLHETLLMNEIFEAADKAMQREVNLIKASVRS